MKKHRKNRTWTAQSENTMRELFAKHGPSRLAEVLSLPRHVVVRKARLMKLTFRPVKIVKVTREKSESEQDYLKRKILLNIKKVNGCWEWQAAKIPEGYGVLAYGGKSTGVHRLTWMLYNGDIPDGLHVCHDCDNPPCCNPNHLFLGTSEENSYDRHAKGRSARGEQHGCMKLSNKEVAEIRRAYDGKYGRLKELAEEYCVSVDQIRNIVRGKQRMDVVSQIDWVSTYDQHAKRPPLSEETKERLRKSLKGRKRSAEVVERVRQARWGNK